MKPKRPNQIALTLEPEQLARLDALSRADNRPRSGLIRQAVDEFLGRKFTVCSRCGQHRMVAGYHVGGPLCGECF